MNTSITPTGREQVLLLENQLRVNGQELDALWMQARSATGQVRSDLHKMIIPLRQKQRLGREQLETLKKTNLLNAAR